MSDEPDEDAVDGESTEQQDRSEPSETATETGAEDEVAAGPSESHPENEEDNDTPDSVADEDGDDTEDRHDEETADEAESSETADEVEPSTDSSGPPYGPPGTRGQSKELDEWYGSAGNRSEDAEDEPDEASNERSESGRSESEDSADGEPEPDENVESDDKPTRPTAGRGAARGRPKRSQHGHPSPGSRSTSGGTDDTESDAEDESQDVDTETEQGKETDSERSEVEESESEKRELSAQTDGDGYARGATTGDSEYDYPSPSSDVGGISTPPDDEELPLADHIEEMILRFAVVLLVGSAATAIGLLWASEAIQFIWFNVFPGPTEEVPPPHVYHPLELWLTRIKVAALAGILVALPMFVYQCYLFMRPGLYPNERKYYLSAVPMSVVLAALGMLFSFLVVLPVLFRYFTFYSEGSADIAYALGETFNLIITLTGILAIVFQIPLFIMLAIMMGVTTRRWLASKRLYFWAAFFAVSFMFTVDPTMMAPILVGLMMVILFESTLALLKWTGRE